MIPDDLKYTKDHEWLRLEGDVCTIGITDHAQTELGDIVFVELPEPGASLREGSTFAVVESVKAVSDCYLPLAGEIVEVNSALEASPQNVNEDPYGEGWIARLKVTDPSGADALMDAAAYGALLEKGE
jgi:glycine cleavage system H protein